LKSRCLRSTGSTEVMVARISEVAKLAGVAPSSVSRVLSDHPDVSPGMKARVLRAAEQLGYQPNFLAQSLRTGATRTVGFVVRDISVPLFAGIVKGAEQVLEGYGYSVLLTNSLQDSALEAKHIQVLRQRRVDGLILSLQSEANPATLEALSSVTVPIVLLDRELIGTPADAVVFDHATGVAEAVAHLAALGHKRIGLIVGAGTRATRDRVRGFRLGCEQAGLPAGWQSIVQLGTVTREVAMEATSSLLDRPLAPTAIVAGDGQLGTAVLGALGERKLRLGQDLSVVICDDLELFRLMSPPISVVARDAEEMGAAAAQVLMNRLSEGSAAPVRQVLPTKFIARGSTASPHKARTTTRARPPRARRSAKATAQLTNRGA
jgi:LacI family transcriptional regulator